MLSSTTYGAFRQIFLPLNLLPVNADREKKQKVIKTERLPVVGENAGEKFHGLISSTKIYGVAARRSAPPPV